MRHKIAQIMNTLPYLYIQMDKNTLKIHKIQRLYVQFSSIVEISPPLYMTFTLKVLHTVIDTAFHFYGMMTYSEHEGNC